MVSSRMYQSRRELIALGSAGIGLGAVGGFLAGRNPWEDEEQPCDPRHRVFDPIDWPAPRYDSAGTAAAPRQSAPTGELEEIWQSEHTTFVDQIGQPVIVSGHVTVTYTHNSRGRIRTIDLTTGITQWDKEIGEGRPNPGDLLAHGSTLYYRGQTEEFGPAVTALSLATGEEQWSVAGEWNPQSGPVLTEDGHIWLTERDTNEDESSIISISADSGADCSVWTIKGNGGGLPRFADGFICYGTDAGAVALDRENGNEQWRTEEPRIPRIVTDDLIYATKTHGWLSAHDSSTGTTEWTVESEHYLDGEEDPDNPHVVIDEEGRSYARPDFRDLALANGTLLARERVWSDHADRITAFNAQTGAQRWQLAPEDEWPASDDRFWYTGPVVAGGSAFVCANRRDGDAELQRIDVESGTITDRTTLDESAMAAPSVGRGVVVVPQRNGIGCFGDTA